MRRLSIAAFALAVVAGGLYVMLQMFFGGIHLSIYQPPESMFEPDQRVFLPQYPTPWPSTKPKLRNVGPVKPAKLKHAPVIVAAPPLPGAAFPKTNPLPLDEPTAMPAPTFGAVTPPPLPGVQMPVGFRRPAPSPTVADVGSGVVNPVPVMPKQPPAQAQPVPQKSQPPPKPPMDGRQPPR